MSLKRVVLLFVVFYLCAGLYLYVKQREFIYFPVKEDENIHELVTFYNQGHKLTATIVNQGKSKAIIYFGGNAENTANNFYRFRNLLRDYTVYLVNYRGYAGSEGEPSESALYSDALYIYDSLYKNYKSVSLIGRSLGSAVATYLASERDIEKLALITPFDSIQNVAQSQFPIFPMAILLKDKFDSYSRVGKVHARTLIIAASDDEVIGKSHTKRLMEGFTTKIFYHVIPHARHNDISEFDEFNDFLSKFFS